MINVQTKYTFKSEIEMKFLDFLFVRKFQKWLVEFGVMLKNDLSATKPGLGPNSPNCQTH